MQWNTERYSTIISYFLHRGFRHTHYPSPSLEVEFEPEWSHSGWATTFLSSLGFWEEPVYSPICREGLSLHAGGARGAAESWEEVASLTDVFRHHLSQCWRGLSLRLSPLKLSRWPGSVWNPNTLPVSHVSGRTCAGAQSSLGALLVQRY